MGLVWGLLPVCGLMGIAPATACALVEARQFEMVSPVYKGGYGALGIDAVAANGESVMFYSPGSFAGAPGGAAQEEDYLSRRSASGWVTTPTMPPSASMPYINSRDVSPALDMNVAQGVSGAKAGNQEGAEHVATEAGFLLHSNALPDAAANWELAGGVWLKSTPEKPVSLKYEGGSADLCHLLFIDNNSGGPANLRPEAANVEFALYELDRGCHGEPVALRLVGVRNSNGPNGEPAPVEPCQVDLGIEHDATAKGPSSFNAIAAGGREIFFTSCVGGNGSGDHQLFVRLDGTRTVEVSRPSSPPAPACSEVPCPDATSRSSSNFVGASEDGSSVFFTSKQPLVSGDTDESENLYMARIGCPGGAPTCAVSEWSVSSVMAVSHDPNGGEAAVQGVLALAPDGQRVYFVATGDLLSAAERAALESEGRSVPQVGADNLYVYDATQEKIGFVADLCTGLQKSGSEQDIRCQSETGSDASLWSAYQSEEAQTAGADGRFLVFSTYAQLNASDTDAAKDVYRYDAATGALERVSVGEAGADANGNSSKFNASIAPKHWGHNRVRFQYELDNRAISEDGSRIVFTSAEPLSLDATNGLTNVYEWHEQPGEREIGTVSLISGGSASEAVTDTVISADGGGVFFVTPQGLVAQDTDRAADVYDARLTSLGAGFPEPPAQRETCSAGDACQGALTNPAPLLVPGSVSQADGENMAPSAKARTPDKPKRKVRPKRHKKGKGGRASRARRGAADAHGMRRGRR